MSAPITPAPPGPTSQPSRTRYPNRGARHDTTDVNPPRPGTAPEQPAVPYPVNPPEPHRPNVRAAGIWGSFSRQFQSEAGARAASAGR